MNTLKASVAMVDITPPVGAWLCGYAARIEPSVSVHDRLSARALLLDDGARPLVIISCDLTCFSPKTDAELRLRIEELVGIPAGSVLIACTHTHAGPACDHFRGTLGKVDEGWLAGICDKIVNLVSSLPGELEPAAFHFGRTMVPGVAYNRQDTSKPIDEEAVTLAIDRPGGSAIATIMNFGCHSVVLGADNLKISGDYPAALTRALQQRRGGIGLFLNGTIGDVDPVGDLRGSFDTVERMGTTLAKAGLSSLTGSPTADVTLKTASKTIEFPLDPPPSFQELDTIEADLNSQLETHRSSGNRVAELTDLAMLDWARETREAMANGTLPASVQLEISIFGINDLRIVAAPFELYSEVGLRIKQALVPHPTAFVSCANGDYGYLAARWAKEQGGYGAGGAVRWFAGQYTALGVGADDILVDGVAALGAGLDPRHK